MATGNYVRRTLDMYADLGDLEALVTADGRRFTYAELRARILDTAAALFNSGLRQGNTIAMLVTNSAETLFIHFGAHLLGCRVVMLAHITPRVFLRGVLRYVEADAFFYEVERPGEIGRELALAAAPLPTYCIGPGGVGPDVTGPPPVTELPFDPAEITQEPLTLFHTSGTTGTPKFLEHGDRYFTALPKVAEFYTPAGQPRMRHLTFSGLWHAGGQAASLVPLLSGGRLVMQSGLDVGDFLTAVVEEDIASTMMAPSMFYDILDDPRLADADIDNLKLLTLSTSPASPARLTEGLARFGSKLNIVYGMSELTFITALTDLDTAPPELLASCGRPWGDVRLEIRDPSGAVLPAGEVGEIWVASDLVMRCYWNMPELTSEILVDGWMATGDAGRLDADGNLYIVDRIKDMVMVHGAGDKIYCRPLEDALAAHPHVRQAAIVGVPDELLRDVMVAYVVRAPGGTVTADELRKHVEDTLRDEWVPQEVEFVAELPLTEFGKVDKKLLRDRFRTRPAVTPTA